MKDQYSSTMKSLMKTKPGMITRIVILVLIVLSVFASIKSMNAEKEAVASQKENVIQFNPLVSDKSYSEVTIQYMSDEFAANYNDTVYYCLAADENNTYVVAVKADQMDKFREIIDYTYDAEDTTPPDTITLRGMPIELEEDLVDYTVEAVNVFWGTDTVDSTNYKMLIGSYYLDSTKGPSYDSTGYVVLLIAAAMLCLLYAVLMMRAEKANKTTKATLERYDYHFLSEADQELNRPETLHFKANKVHLTNRYIISAANGFDIIPYEEIKQIYGLRRTGARLSELRAVVAVTKDDDRHVVMNTDLSIEHDRIVDDFIEHMRSVLPDILYGANEDEFYLMEDVKSGISIEEDPQSKKSNVLLGIIGAFLGAALGGVIWIAIGEFGFIAGLAGFLMMFFAIKGYQMLAGGLDKKGQVISLVIAFLMIFVSNYLLYAIQYCEYFYNTDYSINNMLASIRELPDFLKLGEVTGSFLKDLAVGYLLSIWAGYRLIGSVLFHKSIEDKDE